MSRGDKKGKCCFQKDEEEKEIDRRIIALLDKIAERQKVSSQKST